MKKILVFILLSLMSSLWADRMLYTSEIAEGASLIAVWRSDDLEVRDDNIVLLKKPYKILKGDAEKISNSAQYSIRLKKAIDLINKGEAAILFIVENNGLLDIVGDGGRLTYNELTMKAVKAVLRQFELKKKWLELPVQLQIENADLIVSGLIENLYSVAKSNKITYNKIYRGVPPLNLVLLPLSDKQFDSKTPYLFFLQRHAGTGADYIAMYAIPLKDAEKYLKLLKEIKSSPNDAADEE